MQDSVDIILDLRSLDFTKPSTCVIDELLGKPDVVDPYVMAPVRQMFGGSPT